MAAFISAQNGRAHSRLKRNDLSGLRPARSASPISPAAFSDIEPHRNHSLSSAPLCSHNKILAHLSPESGARLLPHLRRVLLHQNDVLHEQGHDIESIYFVEKGMVSLVMDACSDSQIETAMIGSEGMTGSLCVLGNHPSIHRAIVRVPGKAYRLPVGVLQDEWRHNPDLQQRIMSYTNLILAQVSQTALCSRIHTIEERLSRWLLAVRDRIDSDLLDLTHDDIAQMLGVRRPSVTITLGMLQQAGLIECGRGHVAVKDAAKLQRRACECYCTLRRQFENFGNLSRARA